MKRKRRLVVAAAGSGGHIYPGLAVAQAVRARGGTSVRFVGTPRGLESRIVPGHGFELDLVPVPPLRGRSPAALPGAGWNLVRSLWQMRRLLRRTRADAVFGTGGSVSGAAVLAARLAGVPSLILEPNAAPGLANRWSAPFATTVALGWEATRRHFRGRTVVSGIPVRAGFFRTARAAGPRRRFSVLVTGGSQGASRLNRIVIEALSRLRRRAGRLRFVHQTGPAEEEMVRTAYRKARIRGRVVPYLDDMPAAFADADLVVSRAGAITCAELAAAGRPAIVIPALVAGAHQRQNAAALAEAGAARVFEETVGGEAFASRLKELMDDREERRRMARAAVGLARPDAAARLAALLDGLGKGAR